MGRDREKSVPTKQTAGRVAPPRRARRRARGDCLERKQRDEAGIIVRRDVLFWLIKPTIMLWQSVEGLSITGQACAVKKEGRVGV